MRLLIAALVVVVLVLIDQFRFHGYYGRELSLIAQRAISSLTR